MIDVGEPLPLSPEQIEALIPAELRDLWRAVIAPRQGDRQSITRADGSFEVLIPCGRPGGSYYHVHPVGDVDPKQLKCGHVFSLGDFDHIECVGCGIKIPGEAIACLKHMAAARYSERGQKLADDNGRLVDENRSLLVENATLRRKLERLERTR